MTVPEEFFSADECKEIFEKIVRMTSGSGDTIVSIVSKYSGAAKWARNRVQIASDVRNNEISIQRVIRGTFGASSTTRLDDFGLRQAVKDAEDGAWFMSESPEQLNNVFVNEPILEPILWSNDTRRFDAEKRGALAQNLIAGAEAAGMLSAGSFVIAASGTASMSTDGTFRYYPQTIVECSMTIRDPKGTASGWGGVNHYSLDKINPTGIAETALDKCLRSQNPFAMEPGRYTVILEPQATADFFKPIIERAMDRSAAEVPAGPFGKEPGRSKITEQVLDRRINLSADPMDPDGGFVPYERYRGVPYLPVTWIDQGILRELAYNKSFALSDLGLDKALLNSGSFRLSAAPQVPTSTIEQMVQKTERGLLITRFSNVRIIDFASMLCSGYTRDGVWLIERGKITRPVRNFRFTESPIFALNNLEDIGAPQRVFAPGYAHIAPAVRARDFNFSGLADAV